MKSISIILDNKYRNNTQIDLPLWVYKIINYEYWPWWTLYVLLIPYYLYLAIKAKSLVFFSNVNPGLENSGFKNYSKFEVLKKLPTELYPHTCLIENKNCDFKHEIDFPCILKPDIGERGKGVSLIRDFNEFNAYLANADERVIYQDFANYPYEATIFYVRLPFQKSGNITSFTTKQFLCVEGDGVSTVKDLLMADKRGAMQIPRLDLKILTVVPGIGEVFQVEPIGNHCRGTKFVNANHLISPDLINSFDAICKSIEGFNYGRFDLKYKSLEDLRLGKNFKVVELNGVSADPAHIFDQSTGLSGSIKAIIEHWKAMAIISIENTKRGIRPVTVSAILKLLS
ncbi:MAG TPA: ATP-grasp domain-containing protein [Saprospiraceae bacterium]|nr:ATP-grasp domain-containing protein [Saprospiraceae bacterium]